MRFPFQESVIVDRRVRPHLTPAERELSLSLWLV
jgi:hypothetical protein